MPIFCSHCEKLRASETFRQKKSSSSKYPVGGLSNIHVLRSPSPYPLPKETPRRGATSACPHQIAAALTWCMAAWLPLHWGEGRVRGNGIDARNEPHK